MKNTRWANRLADPAESELGIMVRKGYETGRAEELGVVENRGVSNQYSDCTPWVHPLTRHPGTLTTSCHIFSLLTCSLSVLPPKYELLGDSEPSPSGLFCLPQLQEVWNPEGTH